MYHIYRVYPVREIFENELTQEDIFAMEGRNCQTITVIPPKIHE